MTGNLNGASMILLMGTKPSGFLMSSWVQNFMPTVQKSQTVFDLRNYKVEKTFQLLGTVGIKNTKSMMDLECHVGFDLKPHFVNDKANA